VGHEKKQFAFRTKIMTVHVTSMGSMIDKHFADQYVKTCVANRRGEHHLFRVICAGSVTPEEAVSEYFIEAGRGYLTQILDHEHINGIGESGSFTLMFPERHLIVHDQRLIIDCLDTHPQFEAGEWTFNIYTSSPLIVGGTKPGELRVIHSDANQQRSDERSRRISEIWGRDRAERKDKTFAGETWDD